MIMVGVVVVSGVGMAIAVNGVFKIIRQTIVQVANNVGCHVMQQIAA